MERAAITERDPGYARHAFVARHAETLQRLARQSARCSRMRTDAPDVAQQVALGLLQGRLDPSRIDRAEAYLGTVVRRATYRSRSRHVAREVELVEMDGEHPDLPVRGLFGDAAADGDVERDIDARRRIARLSARLRPRDARALALLVEESGMKLDVSAMAAALGTNANNVYQMRHRIARAAEEMLAEEECGDDDVPDTRREGREGREGQSIQTTTTKTERCPPPDSAQEPEEELVPVTLPSS